MPPVRPLVLAEADAVDALWREAQGRRRSALGLAPADYRGGLLDRPAAFGVAISDADGLVACAMAAPARDDDGHSRRQVPGLAHVYGVATRPDQWGRGMAGRVVRGILSAADRRGFSRAQLWTYDTNVAAARCYTRAGFVRTGRQADDEHGETEEHFVAPVAHPLMGRPAARVLCLDSRGRVLLQRYRDPVDGHEFWEPPGGGIEDGETPIDAALREWAEETGLAQPTVIAGPVDVGRDQLWKGHRNVVSEQFFLAELAADAPAPSAAAVAAEDMSAYQGHAWTSPAALAGLTYDAAEVDPDVVAVILRLNRQT